jgi:hypothetical protein
MTERLEKQDSEIADFYGVNIPDGAFAPRLIGEHHMREALTSEFNIMSDYGNSGSGGRGAATQIA